MKLTYFRLKGYINILNGMGIDELVIPFNTFKNRIIMISGQNGTGKSTIIKSCYPNPDSSDSYRTDVFIDNYGNQQIIEYPAEKELIYEDIDSTGIKNTYRILIQSLVDESRTRRTTKAFISRNGEELNPNGNVSSFKEIRDDVLGTDSTYMDLSSISSENRGIVDMIPSDRRRYMANYIGSLETYNNIYKTISKKVTNLKSYMNTLNNKLYELGNENELRLKQMQLESQYEETKRNRDDILKKLTEAETTVQLIDPDNKIQDIYNSISDRLQSINFKISENNNILVSLQRKNKILSENEDIDKLLSEKKNTLTEYESQKNDNKSQCDKLTSINETLLTSIENDKSNLSGLTIPQIQDNIEKAIQDVKDNIEVYNSYITESDRSILDTVSLEELMDLKNSLDKFLNDILVIEDQFPENDFLVALEKKDTTNFDHVLNELKKSEHISEVEIELLKNKIKETRENLESIEKFNATRPVNCVDDKCPFIANFINLQNSLKNSKSVDELEKDLQREEINLSKYRSSIESMSNIAKASNDINTTINILRGSKHSISKVKSIEFILNDEELITRLKSHNRFYEFDTINELIEKKSVYNELIELEKDLDKMETDYESYLTSKTLVDKIDSSIKGLEELYNKNNESIQSLIKENLFLDGLISSIKNDIVDTEAYISHQNIINGLESEKEQLRIEFNNVKDNIKIVKEKVDSVNSLKSTLQNYEDQLKPLLESINQLKFNLSNIVQYQNEYKEYSEIYDKMTFVRNCCSPGNGMGIQSEYIKRYMADIIIECNKMLAYMFNGAIQLDVPVIDEKSFRLPFISLGGIQVPDISSGSTAQKCMIGLVFSCVAMMKASLKYNIPRLDEIDGGLDQSNRITFIQVLNQILDIMHSEQCIICSHNSEFDTYSTTRIICGNGGIKIEQ